MIHKPKVQFPKPCLHEWREMHLGRHYMSMKWGAERPVDVRLAPTEAERRQGAPRESEWWEDCGSAEREAIRVNHKSYFWRVYHDIEREVLSLSRDYKLYTGTGIYYGKKLIFKKVFDPSIIFYYVDEPAKKVYIIRVLRHERNWQKLLREGISYTFEM